MAKELIGKCLYLGKKHDVHIEISNSHKYNEIVFINNTFKYRCSEFNKDNLEIDLKNFYKKQLHKVIRKRIDMYKDNFDVKHKSFCINDDQTKWGSCDSNKKLTFNWKLMMYQMEVIDYLVVHEMAHLVHMNHGRSFWRLVGKVIPDYRKVMQIIGTKKAT